MCNFASPPIWQTFAKMRGSRIFRRAGTFPQAALCGGYAGTAGGIISTAAGLTALLSPAAFGYLTDVTGSYLPPFAVSMLLPLTGTGVAFFVRADRPLDTNKRSSGEI
jgi:nitrate/nitrite transporter NarK